jgi:hypothetical protein
VGLGEAVPDEIPDAMFGAVQEGAEGRHVHERRGTNRGWYRTGSTGGVSHGVKDSLPQG